MNWMRLFLLALPLLLLSACSEEDPFEDCGYTFVRFDPTSGSPADVPLPLDLLRNPVNGFIELPFDEEPFASVNALKGFSTISSFVIPFDGEIDRASVNNGSMVLVDMTSNSQVMLDWDVVQTPEGTVIEGIPREPLSPETTYLVLVTDAVSSICVPGRAIQSSQAVSLLKRSLPMVDANGSSQVPSLDDATAAQFEQARLAFEPIWAAAEGFLGVGREDIPLAFTFTTQPLFDTMQVLYDRVQKEQPRPQVLLPAEGPAAVDSLFVTLGLGSVPHNQIGAMYYGDFEAPRWLTHPLIGPFPVEGSDLPDIARDRLSFWAAYPLEARGPVPVIIFLHQLNRAKEDILTLANVACSMGMGIIAIDMVQHGERNRDLINNETGALEPDGQLDPSGTFFINLENFRMIRDNIRQSAADLFTLTKMIKDGADFNGDGQPEFDASKIAFLGSSLGGMTGTLFLAYEPGVDVAGLNVSGARLGELVPDSSVAVQVNAALAERGLFPGTPEYDFYFKMFQTVADDAEPLNYANPLREGSLPGGPAHILLQEMIGETVIVNQYSQSLARQLQLPQVDAVESYSGFTQVGTPHVGSGYTQFTGGEHTFLFDGGDSTAQIGAMMQILTYLKTGLDGEPTVINPFMAKGWNQWLEMVPREDLIERAAKQDFSGRFLIYKE